MDIYFCVCVWIIFENVLGFCLFYLYLDLCNCLKDFLLVYKKNILSFCKKKNYFYLKGNFRILIIFFGWCELYNIILDLLFI